MDKLTPEKRSRIMRSIKSKDTKIEVILRKALWHKGYRYRKNFKGLPGSPDIAITKFKIAIFCDSEFFHGYQWESKKLQLGRNREYWINKIERNIQRDLEADRALISLGWVPIHFWGDDIVKKTHECVEAIEDLMLEIKLAQYDEAIPGDDYLQPD